MELPKNITQIGEVNKDCKIYVEDYVVSYMKQLNQSAQDKGATVALYGKRQLEDGISYYFLYGACKVELLSREVRHLSQAQLQEIERFRKRYFSELEFVGYHILNGEMIEGVHICEQEICRYIGGYARFYEKNDAMLAYMLTVREQPEPENVDRTKYEEVQKRQEERRGAVNSEAVDGAQPVEWLKRTVPTSPNLQKMRLAAVGGFALLCLLGIGTFRERELTGNVPANGGDVAASAAVEQRVSQKETLKMEDKLELALLTENQSTESMGTAESIEVPESQETTESQEKTEKEDITEKKILEEPQSEDVTQSEEATQTSQKGSNAVAYIIQPGDTLISICLRQYGSDVRLTDVCSINDISNPDDIKEGQIILLPD